MIRVLVVDDQMVVRNILEEALGRYKMIQVVGKASNALEAKRLIPQLKPDVVTLDVEMPGLSGVDFLDWLIPNYPIPVIMLSSYTQTGAEITLEALDKGAMDFVQKPDGSEEDFLRMLEELVTKIKKLAGLKLLKRQTPQNQSLPQSQKNTLTKREKPGTIQLIAIGASTGGTQAIDSILRNLPNNLPPIVIVQHMPEHFTKLFANRLASTSGLLVKEAENGDLLEEGHVYVAPGNQHLLVRRLAKRFLVELEVFDKVSGHRPSVDVMFESIARGGFANITLGILLTGMGRDGANGLLALREGGAKTLGQDESSSAVYGMPKEAFHIGAVDKQVKLENMAEEILSLV